jgi:glycosyltransferase involved in cell wall biosynthesis
MMRLGDAVLLYTAEEREQLPPDIAARAFIAPNAVCSRRATAVVSGRAMDVLQIGRLVPAKRPLLTLEAWKRICHRAPDSTLVFVGTGPLEQQIRDTAGAMGISNRIRLVGHVSNTDKLAILFANSLFTVCAGYAGLSITQSFAYGVPGLIADDEPHAPEISLANETNSRWFRARDDADLARAMLLLLGERDLWLARRQSISDATLLHYSVETMVDGFLGAT